MSMLRPLATLLLRITVMMPFATASTLANRILEPLGHPWVAVSGGLGGGALLVTALGGGAHLAWRLLCLLMAM